MLEAKSCSVDVCDVRVELLAEGDVIARRLLNGKGWEDETRAAWRSLVVRHETVIDVGAYTGVYSIASAMMGAKAIAVEPHHGNRQRLNANIIRNRVDGGVEIVTAAASDRGGYEQMAAKRWGELCDTGSLAASPEIWPTLKVRTLRVDQLHFPSPVCLLKVDVEGHETAVLLGAIGVIHTYKPKVIVETLGRSSSLIVGVIMTGLGYKQQTRLDGRNELWTA